jgi:DNA-binding NtrC family response regulator
VTNPGSVILVADDDATLRHMVEMVLARAGYIVLSAADGAEALAMSRAHAGAIDLLLTDVEMPHLSGVDLAAAMATERPGAAILVMTGYSSDPLPPHLKPDLLHKPFLLRDLLERIEKALRNGKLQTS